MTGNGSKEMGRFGLRCHGSNLHRFGIGSNGLGSTLKNAKFKGDIILISTQVHSTQFDLSQFDLSYSKKRDELILFDLFHSTHFMQFEDNNDRRWLYRGISRSIYSVEKHTTLDDIHLEPRAISGIRSILKNRVLRKAFCPQIDKQGHPRTYECPRGHCACPR